MAMPIIFFWMFTSYSEMIYRADPHFGQELFRQRHFHSEPFGTIPFQYHPISEPFYFSTIPFQYHPFLESSLFGTRSFMVPTLFGTKLLHQVHKNSLVTKRASTKKDTVPKRVSTRKYLLLKRDCTEKRWHQMALTKSALYQKVPHQNGNQPKKSLSKWGYFEAKKCH